MASADHYRRFSRLVLSDDDLSNLGYPRPDPNGNAGAVNIPGKHFGFTKGRCKRCEKKFDVTTRREQCDFHTERSRKYSGQQLPYGCCGEKFGTKGCRFAQSHVHKGNLFLDLQGYKKTQTKEDSPDDGNYGVFALDTESVHTVKGLEVCKVSLIDPQLKTVYNEFCLPTSEIVDYNTIWSGITERDLKGVTRTFDEMRDELFELISADTVVVGHGLNNDFMSLKIVHDTAVDTIMLYPHHRGLPSRRSLKELAASVLKQNIQTGVGHDSKEDAEVTMRLAHRKI